MAGEPGGVTPGDLSVEVKEKLATTFTHTQGAPAEVWTIEHKLKRFPSVTSQDTAGDEVDGIVVYVSENELTITFSAPFAGLAYCN
jgi:hypothetical protein